MTVQNNYQAFLYWLLLAGLIMFCLFLSWDLSLLSTIFHQDVTRICVIIAAVFVIVTLHCGYRSWFVASQASKLYRLEEMRASHPSYSFNSFPSGNSLIQDYIEDLIHGGAEQEKALRTEMLAESLRGSHQVGWFMAGLVIKLGLLGTVVGFVLMLSSISGLDQLDISDIKELMQQMTQGMGVAMNTTMVGLIASMLLGIQLLLIDRCADRLLLEAVDFSLSISESAASEDRGESSAPLST